MKDKLIESGNDVIVDYDSFPEEYREYLPDKWGVIESSVKNIIASRRDVRIPFQIILKNYKNFVDIRKLRNYHVDKIVTLSGVIRKITDIREEIQESKFICNACSTPFIVKGAKSGHCPQCSKKYAELLWRKYQDMQVVYIQEEQPENGKQPKMVKCILRGPFVDTLQAGNRANLTGHIVTEVNERSALAELVLDVLDVERPDDEYIDLDLTDEDISRITELAHNPDVYRMLVESINPAIWGYNEIKLALVLQMFGGVTIESTERVRGDSHILLCGDPGLAKSQLIRSISRIIPRCIYTSGKSTSAAGLTVSAVNDDLTGHWTLEAGALVLANGSFCVIDELDKMSADDRSALHEAMESQSISVAKAGINQTFKTQCPLLCASNPKNGRFIENIPFKDQIDIPVPLLSRFDLIFMLQDKPNKINDGKVADRILTISDETLEKGTLDRPIEVDLLRKYIIHAHKINPKFTPEVINYIKTKYVNEYRSSSDGTITNRQLEALRRLTQASARVRLSEYANVEDAKRAIALFEYSMNTVTLGKGVDTSVFDSSSTKKDNNTYSLIFTTIRDMCNRGDTTKDIVEQILYSKGVDMLEFNTVFFEMYDRKDFSIIDGKLYWNT